MMGAPTIFRAWFMQKFLASGIAVLLALTSAAADAQKAPAKKPGVDSKQSRKEIRVEARNLAAEVRAPLTAAELAVAERVHVGEFPCELGQTVVLTADAAAAGFFHLRLGKETYRVSPEETTTGAIRLEDKAGGVVWLQLANKSMMMNQKLGRRLADECRSPAQTLVAQELIKHPPPSVFEVLPKPVLTPVLTPIAGPDSPASAAPAAN